VAWYLQREGLKVRGLMEACRELGIETSLPDEVEDWEEIEKI